MKLHQHILLLTFAVLVLLGVTVSCKDKPKPTPTACALCETRIETKKYFLFDVGSWWVYKEETTHEKDSIYVVSSANDPNSPDFDVRYCSPYQDYYYHFFPIITISTQTNGCGDNSISDKKCIYVKNSKYSLGNNPYAGEENCFFSQYQKTASTPAPNIHFSDNKIIFEEIYENYSLPSLSFGKTLKVHVEHSQLENDSPVNYYYVKGVGLVRKEIVDSNQVWNLVDYHVTQ